MAEGYVTRDHNELTPSPRLKDFEGELCFESVLKCFYDSRGKTGLACELELTVLQNMSSTRKTENFVEKSTRGLHAEQAFIRNARKRLRRFTTLEEISVTMLISYSPCFKCREDLQEFFTSCRVPVHFNLKIARLYCDGSSSDEAERKLDFWKNDLELRKVRVSLSAIDVISETDTLRVSIKQQRSNRIDEDARINRQIENIQNGTTHVTKLIKDLKLGPDFKRKYFTCESDEQAILLRLIVSAVTREEKRPTDIIKSLKMNGNEDQLIEEAMLKLNIPLSWVFIRKCLVLVCAHVPSTECQEKITDFLREKRLDGVKNKLVLYIAKVPVDKERRSSFKEWIISLENESIHVCLQPFYAPLPSLSGQIIERYIILKNEFQTLKEEMESTMHPPPSPDSSPNSDKETKIQDEASMSPVGPCLQEPIQDVSETNSASSVEQVSEESSQSSQDEILMFDEHDNRYTSI